MKLQIREGAKTFQAGDALMMASWKDPAFDTK
jgi:hypothetical protein